MSEERFGVGGGADLGYATIVYLDLVGGAFEDDAG
jgi:hypothetical protein